MREVRERLSSAHVISVIALVVALSAGAYAATLPKNSVNSGSVKNESLKGKDVKNNTLTGDDVSEAGLGEVPSATTATNAGNSDLLDNLNATDFLSSAAGAVGPANLAALPGARARATADQTIPSAGGGSLIALDTEDYDTGGMYSPPDNGFVVQRTGTYVISGEISWEDTDPDPNRQITLRVAGVPVAQQTQTASGTGVTNQSVTTIVRATVGDSINMFGRHQAGSDLSLISTNGIGFASLSAQWVSP